VSPLIVPLRVRADPKPADRRLGRRRPAAYRVWDPDGQASLTEAASGVNRAW